MYIRLKIAVCAILLSATMFSCVKEEIAESQMTYGDSIRFGISSANDKKGQPKTKSGAAESEPYVIHGEGITATVTVVDGIQSKMNDMPLTKGTQATSVSAFNVAAYLYPDGATSGVDYFSDLVSDGVNPATTRYWPEFGTLDFLAAAPAGIISTMPSVSDYENGFSFTYAIPEEVADQQDIMVAVAKDQNNSSTGNPVPLQFQHLLAAVQFKVGDMQFIQINSLKISGVLGGDIKFTYDNATNVWTPDLSSASNTSYDLSSLIANTSGLIKGDNITDNSTNSIMLIAPQTLPEGAILEVDWTEVITGIKPESPAQVSLSGHKWEAGKTTVYSLGVSGTEFTVDIPRPDDQDAHYIMLEMSYDLSDPDIIRNVNSIEITARWKTDENGNDISGDTGTSDKRDISLKFNNSDSDLSYTQKQGYWTDWQYLKTITLIANENSEEVETVVEGPKKVVNGNLIGSNSLTLSGNALSSSGKIVLFIDENNGNTDRDGELVFTAKMKSGNTVEIAKGAFKQLCPSWNDKGIGVERIEDGKYHPYGFNYSRTVTFTNPGNSTSAGFLGIGLYRYLDRRTADNAINDLISNSSDNDFITTTTKTDAVFWFFEYSYIDEIKLNYNALSNISTDAVDTKGIVNTVALYNFTGGTSVSQIENDLTNAGWVPSSASGTVPVDYAAFVALSRNRMYELKTEIYQNDGTTTELSSTNYSAVLYKDGSDGLEGNDIVEWFLPSKDEAQYLLETGVDCNGNESVITDLNGIYWSSTAGSDANKLAYTYTFDNNNYKSSTTEDRGSEKQVRAVRMRPTAN